MALGKLFISLDPTAHLQSQRAGCRVDSICGHFQPDLLGCWNLGILVPSVYQALRIKHPVGPALGLPGTLGWGGHGKQVLTLLLPKYMTWEILLHISELQFLQLSDEDDCTSKERPPSGVTNIIHGTVSCTAIGFSSFIQRTFLEYVLREVG